MTVLPMGVENGTCNISPEPITTSPSAIYELIKKRHIVGRWLDTLKDDPLVYGVACYIVYHDIDEPSMLSEILYTTVSDINNAKKRLVRRIADLASSMVMDDDAGYDTKGGDNNAY